MTPKLELRGGDPGEVFVVDECNHLVASFRAKTPDCHRAPYQGRDNFDAGLNLDMAKAFIGEAEKRWLTESYSRFLRVSASPREKGLG